MTAKASATRPQDWAERQLAILCSRLPAPYSRTTMPDAKVSKAHKWTQMVEVESVGADGLNVNAK